MVAVSVYYLSGNDWQTRGNDSVGENVWLVETGCIASGCFDEYTRPDGIDCAECRLRLGRHLAECLYHAGDTSLFSDLKLIGEIYRPDVACLPIGDVYTMGAYDAAVAASWLKCDFAVPLHYATFPALTGTTEQFSEACSQMGVRDLILEPGQSYAFS